MSATNNLDQVRHVQSGDPVASAPTSQPTRALELQIQQLRELLLQQTAATLSKLVIPGVKLADNVLPYDVVHYNGATGLYERAVAGVTFTEDHFSTNPTSLSFGLVLARSGGLGDVMVGGWMPWPNTGIRAAMLETGQVFLPGVPYFLSAVEPGRITRHAPSLRIQILMATDDHLVLLPAFTTPESIESNFRKAVGMRPVGSLRQHGVDNDRQVIVGFDGVELANAGTNEWVHTQDSITETIRKYGWVLADASVNVQPSAPLYVMIEADATTGAVRIFSAGTLAELSSGGPGTFNPATLTLDHNVNHAYAVLDRLGNTLGTLTFRFLTSNASRKRRAVFKFPDSFQGWKMTWPPIQPSAVSVIGASDTATAGKVIRVDVREGGIGYVTPPTVVLSGGGGTGATAVAVLNEHGVIAEVVITNAGTGYTSAPTVTFDSRVTSVRVVNGGYGATLSATVSGGQLTGVAVTAGGADYLQAPSVEVVDVTGAGARVLTEVANGQVISARIVAAGAGYSGSPVLRVRPSGNSGYRTGGAAVVFTSGNAGATPVLDPVGILRVEVLCGGNHYTSAAGISVSGGGGSGADVRPIVENGRIVDVVVLNPGTGFTSAPALSATDSAANAHGARFKVVIGASVRGVTLNTGGTGLTELPAANVGAPVDEFSVEDGGAGYTSAPAVSLSGGQGAGAAATAHLGPAINQIVILNRGSGYTQAQIAGMTISLSYNPGNAGVRAELVPVFEQISGDNYRLKGVEIIRAGHSFSSGPPTLSFSAAPAGVGGVAASIAAVLSNGGSVVVVEKTADGSGYVTPPDVTMPPPPSGSGVRAARATAKLAGFGARLDVTRSGHGGFVVPNPDPAPPTGNFLQIFDYHTDHLEPAGAKFARPPGGVLYYNFKADPSARERYPAVPVEKCLFVLNGVEAHTAALNEASGKFRDVNADVGLSRKTIFWCSNYLHGTPWDFAWRQLAFRPGSGGRDHVVAGTSRNNDAELAWKWWEHLFDIEPQLNRGWLHIARASRFFQSGRVTALGAMAPLRLINAATGVDVSQDGRMLDGQLLLTLDNQINFMGGTGSQIEMARTGDLQVIYINDTGRNVMIASLLLQVVHQSQTSAADVTKAARVVVGTAENLYADLVGETVAADGSVVRGVSARLFQSGQAKELFPDSHKPVPTLTPGQKLYLRVEQPAGAPIVSQVVVVKVKGHVL